MTLPIKFGTDGWRAIIALDFTVYNVGRVAKAQSEWLKPGANAVEPGSPSGAGRALAALGLLDAARLARERLRALRESGLALPAPDYQRVDVAALLRRDARA